MFSKSCFDYLSYVYKLDTLLLSMYYHLPSRFFCSFPKWLSLHTHYEKGIHCCYFPVPTNLFSFSPLPSSPPPVPLGTSSTHIQDTLKKKKTQAEGKRKPSYPCFASLCFIKTIPSRVALFRSSTEGEEKAIFMQVFQRLKSSEIQNTLQNS